MREAFLLAAAVLLLVLAIVGIRRLSRRRYTTIRSNADPSREKFSDADREPANSELPGSARVVGYRDLEDIDTINQRLREEVERNRPRLKVLAQRQRLQESPVIEADADEEIPVLLDPASEINPAPPQPEQESLFEGGDEDPTDDRAGDEPEAGDDDEFELTGEASDSGSKEEVSAPTEVLILNVMTSEERPYTGLPLKSLLFDAGLVFTENNFFQALSDEDGETQYIVANIFNPGTFDVDNMASFSTIGLCFFQPLSLTHDNLSAFDRMLQTAGQIVTGMGGQLCDENRSTLTNQTVEHYRNRIREFDRRNRHTRD